MIFIIHAAVRFTLALVVALVLLVISLPLTLITHIFHEVQRLWK